MTLTIIRDHLKTANECAQAQPHIAVLRSQLSSFDRGTPEDRAALRPEIERCIQRIERARHGR